MGAQSRWVVHVEKPCRMGRALEPNIRRTCHFFVMVTSNWY